MAEKPLLHITVFKTLLATGWIDGELSAEEANAILQAARDEGLSKGDIKQLTEAAKAPIDFDDLQLEDLTPEDKLFVYAAALWVTRVDGKVTPEERSALQAISLILRITRKGQAAMERAVTELAADEERPDRLDLRGLRRLIDERIREITGS